MCALPDQGGSAGPLASNLPGRTRHTRPDVSTSTLLCDGVKNRDTDGFCGIVAPSGIRRTG